MLVINNYDGLLLGAGGLNSVTGIVKYRSIELPIQGYNELDPIFTVTALFLNSAVTVN